MLTYVVRAQCCDQDESFSGTSFLLSDTQLSPVMYFTAFTISSLKHCFSTHVAVLVVIE